MKHSSVAAIVIVAIAVAVALTGCVRAVGATSAAVPTNESTTPSPTASAQTTMPTPRDTASVQPEPEPTDSAAVTIVNWGADGQAVFASGIVTGQVEGGGTCTLTATSSEGRVLMSNRPAEVTPAAVNCGVIRIEAPSGTWRLVLRFRSGTVDASSSPAVATQP